jgi:phospholipid/cholesterol/gamma-HCH transport system ATP-binding protein
MHDLHIKLENVSVITEDTYILNDVIVSFPKGKSTVILGPSGCGKSTLLKTAAGILPYDNGKIFIENKELSKMTEKELKDFRKRNGFVFQDSALWDNRTVYENLALPLQVHFPELDKKKIENTIMDLLIKVDLEKEVNLRPAQISIGEQKIVSFLRAIVTEPEILFMDEPTSSIDSEIAKVVLSMIRDMKRKGCTLVTVTHEPDVISWLADFIIILRSGEVFKTGQFKEISKNPDKFIQAVLSATTDEISEYEETILDLLSE